ncbi:hypothetical protein SBRCBS47491_010180 [Sporothrix bragantina]|uniref:FAD-binding FR-type domain-containing protein n=1 Tax=Sporothrix bragantina TaxID=671064 RepID=A0ABP0D0D0_9PEZI
MILSYTGLAAAAVALLSATTVQAGTPLNIVLPNQECGLVMFDIYGEYGYPGEYYDDYYGSLCQDPVALVSQYASLFTYCKPSEWNDSLSIMAQWCKGYGEVDLIPYTEFEANLTKEAIAALPVIESEDDLPEDSNVTAPFLMSQSWFDHARVSEHWYDYEQRIEAYYTFAGFGFWGIILVFGMVQNLIRKTIESRQGFVYADAEGSVVRPGSNGKPGVFGRAAALARKYIITPSSMPPYKQQRFLGCTIPTRAESFVVISFYIVTLILSCVNYHGQADNIFFGGNAPQIWRYMADRTGTMSYGNLPLLWIFSGRNNIFLWLTGWSFGTFNIFHRHIARIATLQGIMHSIGYTFYYFTAGYGDYYYENYDELWWTAGVVATVIMSFVVLFSFSFFRQRLYENFLIIHIVLSVLLLVFLYYHTNIFDLQYYNYPFILTCCVIWGFDRFLRLVRQVYTNMHIRAGKGFQTTKSTVTYHEAANILTIDVVPANPNLFPGPGQHYYIYQPMRFFGWENHPFTLAHWSQPATPADDLHLQFWVRPYDGWTKKLVKQCKANGGSTATIAPTLLIEGPYLAHEPLHTFDQILLVAGGSGIAGVIPYLQDYVRRIDQGAAAAGTNSKIPTRTRNVTLIWADRKEENLRFVAEGSLAGLLNRPDINVSFHLTGNAQPSAGVAAVNTAANVSSTASSSTDNVESPVTPVGEAEAEANEKSNVHDFTTEKGGVLTDVTAYKKQASAGGFRVQAGRPDVLSTVRKLAQSVHGTDSRLAVMVCGPNDLADNVRHVVAQNMETNRESISYFEESFGW